MKGTAYLIQATLISLWWICLILNQDFYNVFQFPGISNLAFNSFMLPDLSIIAFLSVIRAYTDKKELEYVILGGFTFATLYCINASALTRGGILPTTVMCLGLCYNIFLVYQNRMFRESNTNSIFINATKTIVQIFCVWIITLIVFPTIILKALGEDIPQLTTLTIEGIILFMIFSLFGLYSANIMVHIGKGTPLPLDQTQKLVTKGPYNYVRNPMAIAGIGQGVSVSIMLGSFYIFLYAVLGGLLWHFVVRPLEEDDMLKRFGKDYKDYRLRVNCWLPKFNKKN